MYDICIHTCLARGCLITCRVSISDRQTVFCASSVMSLIVHRTPLYSYKHASGLQNKKRCTAAVHVCSHTNACLLHILWLRSERIRVGGIQTLGLLLADAKATKTFVKMAGFEAVRRVLLNHPVTAPACFAMLQLALGNFKIDPSPSGTSSRTVAHPGAIQVSVCVCVCVLDVACRHVCVCVTVCLRLFGSTRGGRKRRVVGTSCALCVLFVCLASSHRLSARGGCECSHSECM
jgi:hypothetical protein